MDTIKYLLSEDQMPTAWYNIQADLSTPLPPVLHPGTGQPITPDVRYSDKNGAYTRKMPQRAYEVFEVLQKLTSWLDPKPKTKTAYIYNND